MEGRRWRWNGGVVEVGWWRWKWRTGGCGGGSGVDGGVDWEVDKDEEVTLLSVILRRFSDSIHQLLIDLSS